MGKSTSSGAGGRSPAGKNILGNETIPSLRQQVVALDKELDEAIAAHKAATNAWVKAEAGYQVKQKEKALADAQKALQEATEKAQALLAEKAGQLQRLQSREAKIAADRSEAAVMQYAKQFQDFSSDELGNSGTSPGANAWGFPKYDPWISKLTMDEATAIESYAGSGFGKINKLLRFGEAAVLAEGHSVGLAKQRIAELDSALAKAPITSEPIQAVRYFNLNSMYDHMKDYGTLNGAIVKDNGFVSSSLDKNWDWSGGFKAKILIPKGSQGAYIQRLSDHKNEHEFVLPRGTKFKIIRTKSLPGAPDWGAHTEITMIAYTPNHPKYRTLKAGFGGERVITGL